jgi:hypothetical protein
MKRFFPIVFLLVACICLSPSMGFAQDNKYIQTVNAEGTSLIVNDDLASGRNSAIQNALQKAVENVVVTLIPPKTMAKKSQAINDRIYTKCHEYIHDYRIISEKQIQAVYSVNMRATIFVASIKNDLQTMGLINVEKDRVPVMALAITVRGIKSCADYMKVLELIRTKVVGVSNFYQRRFEWGMARLDLDIQGTIQSLKNELIKTGHFSLDISRVAQNDIEVTYLKK